MVLPALSNRFPIIAGIFALLFAICWGYAINQHAYAWMIVPFLAIGCYALLPQLIQPDKRLFWLLFITIPLSTEWQITTTLGLDFPDELLMGLLSVGIVMYLLLRPASLPPILLQSNLFTLLLLGWIWTAITCIYSTEPVLSVKFLLAKCWFILPFVFGPLMFIQKIEDWKTWAACWLIPMLILVVQVIIRHGQYGFTFFHIRKAMAPFFRNHVNYAALISLLLPVAILSFYLTPRFSPRRKWILFGIVIGFAGWILAYSRGAWVALPAGGIMVLLIRKKWLVPVVITGAVLVLISTAWLVTEKRYLRFAPDHDQTYFHTQFRQHLQATFDGKDISTAERWHRWVAGVRMLTHEPITGFGPNSFYRQYQPYTLQKFQTWVSDNPEHSTVHNYFLLIAVEQGWIGLLLFLLLVIGMFLSLQRLCRKLQSHFYRSIALATSAILTIVVALNLMSDLIETDKIGSVFYACLGVILLLEQESRREKSDIA